MSEPRNGKTDNVGCASAHVRRMLRHAKWLPVLLLALATAWFATSRATADSPKPEQNITALILLPDALTLTDARDVQHVLVLGQTESGQRIDLSPAAGFQASGDTVSVSASGA